MGQTSTLLPQLFGFQLLLFVFYITTRAGRCDVSPQKEHLPSPLRTLSEKTECLLPLSLLWGWCKQLFCYTHKHRYYTFGLKDLRLLIMPKIISCPPREVRAFRTTSEKLRRHRLLCSQTSFGSRTTNPAEAEATSSSHAWAVGTPNMRNMRVFHHQTHLFNRLKVLFAARQSDRLRVKLSPGSSQRSPLGSVALTPNGIIEEAVTAILSKRTKFKMGYQNAFLSAASLSEPLSQRFTGRWRIQMESLAACANRFGFWLFFPKFFLLVLEVFLVCFSRN